jgi:hypothetical protein
LEENEKKRNDANRKVKERVEEKRNNFYLGNSALLRLFDLCSSSP